MRKPDQHLPLALPQRPIFHRAPLNHSRASADRGNRSYIQLGRVLVLVCVPAVCLGFLTGCGDDDPTTTAPGDNIDTSGATAPESPGPSPEEKLRDNSAEIVEEASIVCGIPTREKFARDFNLDTTDPQALAHRYARGYDEIVRARVEVACLKAILDNDP